MPAEAHIQTFGRYRIRGLLGRGGMGSVYLADQTGPGGFSREVVLKLLQTIDVAGSEHRQMLLEEAQLTALISHPNVVTVFEVGEHLGRVFIALERVRGISFALLCQRLAGRRLPIPVAAAMIAQACEGLHAAHELRRGGRPLNLIHRDVSLSNLMCDIDGRVRVIDFGIARSDGRQVVTDPSAIRGNPAYMAPEQLGGAPLDRRADIYSAALVFRELAVGQHPFGRGMLRTALPPLRSLGLEIDPALDQVVSSALSLDPQGRPSQLCHLGGALSAFARRHGLAGPAHVARFFRREGVSLEPPEPARECLALGPREADEPRAAPPRPREAPARDPADGPGAELRLTLSDERVREVALPEGRTLTLHTTHINTCERGDNRQLALSRIAGLLPAALVVNSVGVALRISCEGATRDGARAALYVDAQQPHTRLESLLLTEASLPHSFDVGHRKGAVRQIAYAIGRREAQATVARPHEPRLRISAPADLSLLVVLTAYDDAGAPHVECVCLRR